MSRLKRSLLVILFIVPFFSSLAQETLVGTSASRDTMFWGMKRKTLVRYGMAAYSAGIFYVQFQWWWKGNYHPFAVNWERGGVLNDYDLGVDKIGHMYTSYAYFLSLYDMMQWGGFDKSTSIWTGVAIASFHALSSEIGDGFTNFGFTPGDLLFNAFGLGYALLQINEPFLQNFKLKFSYWPSPNRPRNRKWDITEDYDGHIYWLSINVHDLLPESARSYWPRFLNLAIGYGGTNISTGLERVPRHRKFAIGLDYNITIFGGNDDSWNTVLGIFDRFHFPAPGARYIEGQGTIFKPFLVN